MFDRFEFDDDNVEGVAFAMISWLPLNRPEFCREVIKQLPDGLEHALTLRANRRDNGEDRSS